MRKVYHKKQDRQGQARPGRPGLDNEYKDGQRNPEPTTKISPPPVSSSGQVEARFDAPVADGDNRAVDPEVGTERPYVPMPHEEPEWSEEPEGQIMRLAELLATSSMTRPQIEALFSDWLTENLDSIPSRAKLMKDTSFFIGRLRKSIATVEEVIATAIAAIVPADTPKTKQPR